ncbi:MAG: abortive infection system antitoxin AbiGi family protein, partial [Candidatus Marinimicrobia bacterium]|nr:abortive infection system antitoxin AbiGi family protein [Candidatus Neomarinimicrobiota bacterium]
MTKISTDNLYHYTKKFGSVLSILKNGFEFKPLKEGLPLTGFSTSVFSRHQDIIKHSIYVKAVCFCDLPFGFVSKHIEQYGNYCIGLTKKWGMGKGITPIRYVHYYSPDLRDDTFDNLLSCAEHYDKFDNSMLKMINRVFKEIDDLDGITDVDYEKLPKKWKRIIAQMDEEFFKMIKFTPTYIGNMRNYEGNWRDRVTGKTTTRRFYDEREWRALKTKKDQKNLIFNWDDITEIIIK